MNPSDILVGIIYTGIIASLVWARYMFFEIRSASSRISSFLYDPAIIIQVAYVYYSLLNPQHEASIPVLLAIFGFGLSFSFFWWGIGTAKKLDFAYSKNVSKIITNGPFAIVRHPFYLSYIFCWLTSTLLFNSFLLWITLAYLITFYFISARREEKVIMQSTYAKEYASYKKEVGMFLPRVAQWKSWFLRCSRLKVK